MMDEMEEFRTEDVMIKGVYTMNNMPAYNGTYI
jgi:hypothetical protein